MKSVNLTKARCSWCDAPAALRIVDNGWVDFTCQEHGRHYFPDVFASPGRCATKSCESAATHEITYPGLGGRTVGETVCQPCGSKYVTADPYVTMTGL